MKFIYLAVSCCTLWTLISALPLTSLLTPRGSDQRVERRSLYARTEPRRSSRLAKTTEEPSAPAAAAPPPVPYALSMKRTQIGTEHEHWAMHFHPQQAGAGNLHVLDAASDKRRRGVLRVETKDKGVYNPPATQNPLSHTQHIANFNSKEEAMAAMHSAKTGVHLTEKFPEDNCVDFTCKAALHMASPAGGSHISAAAAQSVVNLHTTHAATVKTNTDTDTNREKTGQ